MRCRSVVRVLVPCWVAIAMIVPVAGQAPAQDAGAVRGQTAIDTVLKRRMRPKSTVRGDKPGQIRVKWEWYQAVVNTYRFERNALTEELSANEKFAMREDWLFGDTKVTFQDLFGLGPEDDDKLVPILAHYYVLSSAPSSSFEGVTLYGKQGEVKGPVTRKYMARGLNGYAFELEYKKPDGGLDIAQGISVDAFNVRWKDIKDKIADETTAQKAAEDRQLFRAAYEKDFRDSEKAR